MVVYKPIEHINTSIQLESLHSSVLLKAASIASE